jgi:hypothetical protein
MNRASKSTSVGSGRTQSGSSFSATVPLGAAALRE